MSRTARIRGTLARRWWLGVQLACSTVALVAGLAAGIWTIVAIAAVVTGIASRGLYLDYSSNGGAGR